MVDLVNKFTGPKLTDKEVIEGEKPRSEFRDEIVRLRATWLDPEKKYAESFDLLGISSEYKKITKFFEDELSWLNGHIEMSLRQVNKQKKEFYEKFQQLQDAAGKAAVDSILSVKEVDQQKAIAYFPITQYKSDMGKQLEKKENKIKEEEKEKAENIINSTPGDQIISAIKSVLKWVLIIGVILVFLRVASFSANESLWKPLPFRIISFFYTFIFGIIWTPYYFIRAIRHYFNPEIELPRFESLLPIYEYDQNQPASVMDKLFGFPNSKELCDWAIKKRDENLQSREEAAKPSTLFDKIIEERKLNN